MADSELTWVVELKAAPFPQPLRAQFEKRLIIGRSDSATNVKPDVDLSPYDAQLHGISRQHAALVAKLSQLLVVDMNSGNGTFLNGNRLEPHQEVLLRAEDHLQLGSLPIAVRVIIAPSYAVGFYTDSSLQMHDEVLPGAGQTVLLVHHDEEVTRALTMALEKCGFKVAVARSVVTAIRQIGQKRPSAVIVDWALPDMPGVELLRYIKRDAQLQTTPVVVVAQEKTPAVVKDALDAGADVVLAEPLSLKELQHIITTCVAQPEHVAANLETKLLVGTAPLQAIQPQRRRNSVVLFIAGSKEPLVLTLTQPLTFGRSVSKALQTHVDLTRHNAVDNGVSRVHARLLFDNSGFFVEDLNSVNGTYVNGQPLKPGELTALKSADELRLGRLGMTVYFLEDSDKSE